MLPLLLTLFMPAPVDAVPSFPIEMDMVYCYEDDPCGETIWTFTGDGRFTSLSSEGEWWVSRGSFRLVYDHGSEYRGTLEPERGCITGVNLRNDGDRGTFEACLR